MKLTNIFKKKEPEKPVVDKRKTAKVSEKKPETKTVGETKVTSGKPPVAVSSGAWQVLRSPHITEKATDLTKLNQYVFEVTTQANKISVKKAVEETYGVDVVKVRIVNIPRRQRRLGRTKGWKAGYKKAIVRVKEGQKIEVLPR